MLLLFACVVTGCDFPSLSSTGGTATATAVPETPSGSPRFNTWETVGPGIQTRYEDWKSSNNEDRVTIVRFDLHHIRLTIGYQPTQPLTMSAWMQQEQATALINGGYFDNRNRATGLIVSNGQVSGASYSGYGGMLYVDAQGKIGLRSLRQQPYDPSSEQLSEATQSSPMLMIDGQRTQFQANASESRRTVVAMDKQGNLLFIVSPGQAFSLDELADLLSTSDLSLKTALNLDGGASTGLYVKATQAQNNVTIDSVTTLPIVIAVKVT